MEWLQVLQDRAHVNEDGEQHRNPHEHAEGFQQPDDQEVEVLVRFEQTEDAAEPEQAQDAKHADLGCVEGLQASHVPKKKLPNYKIHNVPITKYTI